jgi:predicted porin
MKKHIIAVAVAAAFAAPVAMADTTLYGLANMSLDYIDVGDGQTYKRNANGTFTNDKIVAGSSNVNVQSGSSRLGVKGSEKISKDLSAVYQAEFGVEMAEGSTALSSRNQYVGLSSKSFGTFIAGRHDTPMKLAWSKYDLFGDQIGDNGNMSGHKYGTSAGFNLRTPNTIAYLTPDLAGFNATLAYVADHDQVDTAAGFDDNNNQAFSGSVGYTFKKLFSVVAAYENHQQKAPAVSTKSTSEDAWMIGGGLTMAGFTVNAQYMGIENFDDVKADIWGLGAAYTFGKKHTVKGQYYNAEFDGYADGKNMFALGYDFKMSKQTTLFAAYAYGDNGQSTWGDGHGGKTPISTLSDQDSNVFSVGMKYKF